MSMLTNLFVFLLLLGIYTPSSAAVVDDIAATCSVFNQETGETADKKDGDKKGQEEEPECE
ncbi:MAG: hypothetical protein LJE83_06810 [Gammaproteobacteria bacterium]|nr:hypothetical protein [Gammaproteobacteria bacterium]